MLYTTTRGYSDDFESVVARLDGGLRAEGFDVMYDLELDGAFAGTTGEGGHRYTVLGVCTGRLLAEGLHVDRDLGALLPCNVAIYEGREAPVVVSAVDPITLLGVADNSDLDPLASETFDGLVRVLNRVGPGFET